MTTPFAFSLRHFFEGGMSREEAASASLAMLLEGSAEFRLHFFTLVLPEEAAQMAIRNWDVRVEFDQVDIRLASDDMIVLIENKLGSGAKQVGQLLRYYRQQRAKSAAPRIVAVYLAPRGIGMDEVERTRPALESPADRAVHLSWQALATLPQGFAENHTDWIRSILAQISAAIDAAYISKYRREGERKTLRDIVDRAVRRLKSTSAIGLKRWSGKGVEEVFSTRTAVSLSSGIVFPFVDEEPYPVVGVVSDSGELSVDLRTYVSLAGKVRKSSPIAAWWKVFAVNNELEVPGLGRHISRNNSFLEHSTALAGTEAAVEDAIVDSWRQLSDFVDEALLRAGLGANSLR